MPGRPPREWFRRCFDEVAASGTANIPGAVCAVAWQRKTPRAKRAIVRLEEGPMSKKKKKKGKKTPKRAAPKRKAKKKSKARARCKHCGHAAAHGKSGCTHFAAGKFCGCTVR